MCICLGSYFPDPKNGLIDIFDAPPCERRAAFSAVRFASGWGSAPIQIDVVKVLYLPQYDYDHVIHSVASADFLAAMQTSNYAISNGSGSLINVSRSIASERPNFWASLMVNRDVDYNPLEGQFYWVEKHSWREPWWRTSVRYDPERMPGLYGKHQVNLRKAIHSQIVNSGLEVGPFFVETVWEEAVGRWDLQSAWFDIYAPSETALVAIVSTF